ncbi:MAG: hypothetical protein OQK29_03290 [Ignavibacteriaceae bacterium]|nr:hypothetical protein [Ignavibacteriaceae bacterium]
MHAQSQDTLFLASWNLQNLFDTVDDPQKNDEEFLPNGEMQWTKERLDKKLYNLARVIRSMNNGAGPDLLGVCEVEHEALLDSMIKKFLPDLDYKTAYIESPDNRGIDNGLIFKANEFKVLNVQVDTVHISSGLPTRLIMGVNLLTDNNEKITVFVNHWPSRSGGQIESEPNRIEAAKTLRYALDRIFKIEEDAQIFIIGDFNDDPINKSVLETLRAHPIKCDSLNAEFEVESEGELFNLSYKTYESGLGSYKYRNTWNLLDQIIVSGSLINGKEINYICQSFKVYKPNFMVTKSGVYQGAPFPTYGGSRYLGGYSDHFPVISKFKINRNFK